MVTLSRLFSSVLDLVYPPKCALCGQLGEKHALCTVCFDAFKPLEKQLSYSAIPSPLDYWASLYLYEGRAAQAVRLLKYKRVTSLAKPLSQLIWQGIQELGLTEVDAIVPVPLHWRRQFERGFNQAELLCSAIPQELLFPQLLKRTRLTPPQASLSPHVRTQNIMGCTKASSKCRNKEILLIDDVMTSKGTALACAESLKEAGAKRVGILTLTGWGYLADPDSTL